MDNIKFRPHAQRRSQAHSQGSSSGPSPAPKGPVKKERHTGQKYWLVRSIGKVAAKGKQTAWARYKQTEFAKWPKKQLWRRAYILGVILLFITSTLGTILQPFLDAKPYNISPVARQILPKKNQQFGELLQLSKDGKQFSYNQGATAVSDSSTGANNKPRFSATFSKEAKNGVTISDTVSQVDMTLKPKFALQPAKKEDNYLMYKLSKLDGVVVYTSRTASVKEDIILESFDKDDLTFEFELGLANGLEARVEKDGSLGVYGSSLPINGNVSTGSDADAALLEKARQNADKTKLLFQIPAPVVLESSKKISAATSKFELDGKTLKVITTGLSKANFPLSIDPTVYVETAAKLMRGNNETNVDFDVDNELIQKSQTTGARIDSWTSTNNLSTPVWGQGTAASGGYIYSAGGKGGTSTFTSTYYSATSTTFSVPAGVTSLTVKAWGAGGGGGAGVNSSGVGGNGGGGGYAKSVITVTPGETLDVLVGSGGAKAGGNRQGGDGGGYSSVSRGATFLLQAGGGGGGGGSEGTSSGNGGNGGAGGGTSGIAGSNGGNTSSGGGGGGGTTSAGGTAGTTGTGGAAGSSGAANVGGDGGASTGTCNASVSGNRGGAGGQGGGGDGGNDTSSCEGGGGGGGGRFGGGGGGSVNSNNRGAGGGGGGSSLLTGTSQVNTAGSGATPGNNGDSQNNNAGNGGTGATTSGAASNGADGGVVISYTTGSATTIQTVSWAKFNTSTNAIESPNPGNGTCSGWCTNTSYNLPTALSDLSLVAYNGYLYALGGANSSNVPQTSVYIAKLGANGEPQLWHPTDSNKNNWVYWYSDTALSNARSKFGAVAYNNKLYIMGGLTTASTLITSNTVQLADIKPMGTLTSWTTTGTQALTSNRYGLSVQVYNDTIYAIGGSGTTFPGTPISTVQYTKLDSSGNMLGWNTTTPLNGSARLTMGGTFSTIFGGYIYVAGGCTTMNASGYCTAIASDVLLASINADGSITEWNTILNLTNTRIGHTLVGWQGGLYRLGGCRTQDAATGVCTDTVFDVDYGVINPAGEASTVATSSTSGASTCAGGSPYNCDLPSANVGNMLNAVAVTNGYLYVMGGCTDEDCGSASGADWSAGVTYQAIGSDGRLQRPATCTGTYVDSYCVSSSSLPSALAAAGTTVFNGRIYVVGGFPSISNIYYVSVNADGSLGTWQNNDTNTGTTTAADAVSYTFAYARANPASAGTNPGNLYIFGGCSGTITNIGCSGYSQAVYKCNITTSGTVTSCSTSGQLQIGTVTGNDGSPAGGTGLGAFAAAVYANYIYLMGGLAPGTNGTDLKYVRYAKFDDTNNVVAVSGSAWIEGANQMNTGRRRGAGFGYNGYLYVLGGYDGADAIADIEFAKINVSDGSWESFDTSSVSIQKRWALTTVVSNSYAYVVGGCVAGAAPGGCTTRTNSIQTFQMYNNDSGAIADFTAQADQTFATETDRWGSSSAILNGYLYVAGGCKVAVDCSGGGGGDNVTNNVQYAPISSIDGSVGTWNSATNGLPADRAWGQLEIAGGNLYYLGGHDDTATNEQSTVYYAGTISSGNITTAWTTALGGIGDTASQAAQPRSRFGATVWNNRIYVVGGLDGSAAVTNTVYISPQLTGTGIAADSWVSDVDVPDVARTGAAVVAYANNLYIFGGFDGTNYLNDAQFTQINSDGTVDAWTFTTSLPSMLRDGEAIAANGYIYIVGGRSAATTCTPSVLVTSVSANTTIASGNNPTGVGEWYETNVRYTGDRYGAAVSYSGGKFYMMGGGCSAPLSSNRHYLSTVKSQPQIAKYSRMIDTDSDVFPTSWLLNGVDNDIGARWQVKYRSMHDIDALVNPSEDCGTSATMAQMTTWGQETNFGDTRLGIVNTYTPLNSSGGNINCARYYYFLISIDASQTFGYPEDVNRGPTIADISLFFTADPSKRLRHGKTFTGGEQQPEDTPCRKGSSVAGDPNFNCPLP